jgi:hypothetical protein
MYFAHWIGLHIEHLESISDKPAKQSAFRAEEEMSIASSRSGSPRATLPPTEGAMQGSKVPSLASAVADNSTPTSPHPITDVHLRWVFALLARVDEQTSADEMAQLRALARVCIQLVVHHAAASSACWMIVAVIAGVWAQRDLWMDAEEALRNSGH